VLTGRAPLILLQALVVCLTLGPAPWHGGAGAAPVAVPSMASSVLTAPVKPARDAVGKVTVIDNYQWMEMPNSAELANFLHASTSAADHLLERPRS
jgi:hypothetical protein